MMLTRGGREFQRPHIFVPVPCKDILDGFKLGKLGRVVVIRGDYLGDQDQIVQHRIFFVAAASFKIQCAFVTKDPRKWRAGGEGDCIVKDLLKRVVLLIVPKYQRSILARRISTLTIIDENRPLAYPFPLKFRVRNPIA